MRLSHLVAQFPLLPLGPSLEPLILPLLPLRDEREGHLRWGLIGDHRLLGELHLATREHFAHVAAVGHLQENNGRVAHMGKALGVLPNASTLGVGETRLEPATGLFGVAKGCRLFWFEAF